MKHRRSADIIPLPRRILPDTAEGPYDAVVYELDDYRPLAAVHSLADFRASKSHKGVRPDHQTYTEAARSRLMRHLGVGNYTESDVEALAITLENDPSFFDF